MRCPRCPAPASYCHAESAAVARLCDLAATTTHYRDWLALGVAPESAPPRPAASGRAETRPDPIQARSPGRCCGLPADDFAAFAGLGDEPDRR
ncbi:MAG TPA: hypothetical protein VG406_02925 [Isosphaeraceae bacterium]|nr:hypothetical protein [Isosphaeraceae bacterium]